MYKEVLMVNVADSGKYNLFALLDNANKQGLTVCVIGGTCTGKTRLASKYEGAVDMEDILFGCDGKLSEEEIDVVCQSPWTEEIEAEMERLARKYVKPEVGKPVFGTCFLDADILIYIFVDNETLSRYCDRRKVSYDDAKAMGESIAKRVRRINKKSRLII